MKNNKTACVALLILVPLFLGGCAPGNIVDSDTVPVSSLSETADSRHLMTDTFLDTSAEEDYNACVRYEIFEVGEDGMLAGELDTPGGLAWVSFGDILLDTDGNAITAKDLNPGMIVNLSWNGMVMETYPCQFSFEKLQVVEGKDTGTFLLYCDIIKALIEKDDALNENINEVYFDFTAVNSLSEIEKSALAYVSGGELGCMGSQSTLEDLAEAGIYKDGNIEDALMIIVEELSYKDNELVCSAGKYRSALGAYHFGEIQCQRKDGRWTFEVIQEAIS